MQTAAKGHQLPGAQLTVSTLTQPGSPAQSMVPPTVDTSLPTSMNAIKIIPTGHPNVDSPSFKTLFPGNSWLYQVDKTNHQQLFLGLMFSIMAGKHRYISVPIYTWGQGRACFCLHNRSDSELLGCLPHPWILSRRLPQLGWTKAVSKEVPVSLTMLMPYLCQGPLQWTFWHSTEVCLIMSI